MVCDYGTFTCNFITGRLCQLITDMLCVYTVKVHVELIAVKLLPWNLEQKGHGSNHL